MSPRPLLKSLLYFNLLQSLFAQSVQARTFFEEVFCNSSGGTCNIPTSIAEVRSRLEVTAASQLQPPPVPPLSPETAASLGLAQALFIPEGRSLQRGSTSFTQPRIVLAMTRGVQIQSPNGGRFQNFSNPIGDKLFVGYSPGARTLEVISWDPATRQYEFFKADNFPTGPQGQSPTFTRQDRTLCMSCHQNGGPILSRAPWSETSSSHTVASRLCESLGGSNSFQGVAFTDQCPPTAMASPPFPPNSDRMGLAAATTVDTAARNGSRTLQATQACQSMCGTRTGCRRLVIETALRLPRSNRVGWSRTDPVQFERSFLEGKAVSPPGATRTAAGPNATQRRLISRLQSMVAPAFRQNNGYEYRSSVLPDVDASTSPPSTFRVSRTQGRRVEDLTYAENQSISSHIFPPDMSMTRVPLSGDVQTDPLVPRPMTGAIPTSLSGLYAFDNAFDCLGLNTNDAQILQTCTASQGIEPLLRNPAVRSAMDEIALDWRIGDSSRSRLMVAVRTACGMQAAEICPTTQPVFLDAQAAAVIEDTEQVTAHVDSMPLTPAERSAQTMGLFRDHCAGCHGAGRSATLLPLGDANALMNYRGSRNIDHLVCKHLAGASGFMRMPPGGPTLPAEDRSQMNELLGGSCN